MNEVTDPELIKKLESKLKAEEKSNIDVTGLKEVTDPELLGKLNTLSTENEEKSFLSGVGCVVIDLLSFSKLYVNFPYLLRVF